MSQKLQGQEQSKKEERFATPAKTLQPHLQRNPTYRVRSFKF